MNLKQIREVAWIGDGELSKPVRGVMLRFHGLGDNTLRDKCDPVEAKCAAAGALVVHPYYGTWSWMNRQARRFVDGLVADIYKAYRLGPRIPLISTGGSMGGFSALVYTRYAKKRVSACMAVFPVTDLKLHFSERNDLPRTIHYAFREYKEPYAKLFREHSPLEQAANMPRIPYLVIHGDKDKAVSKTLHSDRFVARMRKLRHSIEYVEVPGMGHGCDVPPSVDAKQVEFVVGIMNQAKGRV